MSKTIITTLLATAMLAGIAAPAFAAGNDGAGRHAKRAERMIETFDADGDGSVTATEIKDHRTATFTSVDADGNGMLSQEEFDMLRQIRDARRAEARKQMTEAQGAGEAKGKWMGGKGMGKGKNGEGRGPSFTRMDADGDGSVSLAEFTANSDRMFARLDRNSDGVVTTADFQKKARKAN